LSSTNWLSVTPLPMAAVEELGTESVFEKDIDSMTRTHIPPVTVIIIESA
jgi:hypothetical protein